MSNTVKICVAVAVGVVVGAGSVLGYAKYLHIKSIKEAQNGNK